MKFKLTEDATPFSAEIDSLIRDVFAGHNIKGEMIEKAFIDFKWFIELETQRRGEQVDPADDWEDEFGRTPKLEVHIPFGTRPLYLYLNTPIAHFLARWAYPESVDINDIKQSLEIVKQTFNKYRRYGLGAVAKQTRKNLIRDVESVEEPYD